MMGEDLKKISVSNEFLPFPKRESGLAYQHLNVKGEVEKKKPAERFS